jgi:hypothetical protein
MVSVKASRNLVGEGGEEWEGGGGDYLRAVLELDVFSRIRLG